MLILLLLACLYAFDLLRLVVTRSTHSIRKLHYWIEKIPSLDESNPNADIATKSYQYLPNYRVLIGSLPRYASVLSMILVLNYYPDLDFVLQLGIGLSFFFGVEYILNQTLRYYCLSVYSNMHKIKKMENKT